MLRAFTLLLLVFCAAPAVAGPEQDATREALLAALASSDLDARARAFEVLDAHADFATLKTGLEGVRRERRCHQKGISGSSSRSETYCCRKAMRSITS